MERFSKQRLGREDCISLASHPPAEDRAHQTEDIRAE